MSLAVYADGKYKDELGSAGGLTSAFTYLVKSGKTFPAIQTFALNGRTDQPKSCADELSQCFKTVDGASDFHVLQLLLDAFKSAKQEVHLE